MKKSITRIILVLIVLSFGGAMYYLYQKNAEDPVVYETEKPSKKNIIKKLWLQVVFSLWKKY